ncbi:hypothetical protein AKJ16_DCAP17383 [Drosera capensis]
MVATSPEYRFAGRRRRQLRPIPAARRRETIDRSSTIDATRFRRAQNNESAIVKNRRERAGAGEFFVK